MRRREFITILGGAVVAWPLAGRAQQTGKVYRVGLIITTSPVSEMVGPDPIHPLVRTFVHTLRALGYVEGQNLVSERRSAEGKFERFGEIGADLIRQGIDVIVVALDRCDAARGVGCMRWTVRTGMLPSSPTLSM